MQSMKLPTPGLGSGPELGVLEIRLHVLPLRHPQDRACLRAFLPLSLPFVLTLSLKNK